MKNKALKVILILLSLAFFISLVPKKNAKADGVSVSSILWNQGYDASGTGQVLNAYGIEHDNASKMAGAYMPLVGSCGLFQLSNAIPASGINLASQLDTVYLNDIPFSEIDEAVFGDFATYLFIYVPARDGIIKIGAGTEVFGFEFNSDFFITLKGIYASSIDLSYSIWTKGVKVSFDSNGGSAVSDLIINENSKVTKPTDPTHLGDSSYLFDYWYKDNENVPFDFENEEITSNIELHAKWTKNENEVHVSSILWSQGYDASGTGQVLNAYGIEHDNACKMAGAYMPLVGSCGLFQLSKPVPISGDNLASQLDSVYLDGVPFSEIDGAVFGDFGTYLFIYVPARDGIIKIGDGTEAFGFEFNSDFFITLKGIYASNIDLSYSIWTKGFKVSFDSNGGSAVSDLIINENSKVTKPTDPTYLGDGSYTLEYWYKDNENVPFDFENEVITSNIELHAKWTNETLKNVTFNDFHLDWNDNFETFNNGLRYTMLLCSGIESTGNIDGNEDFSDLVAKSTLNDGLFPYLFIPSSFLYGPNISKSAFIMYGSYIPQNGDVIKISAGAKFKEGGEDNNKYVLLENIEIKYINNKWVNVKNIKEPTEFEILKIEWNGADLSGLNGGILDRLGIENDHKPAARPYVGSVVLLKTNVEMGNSFTDLLSTLPDDSILVDGVDIKTLDGFEIRDLSIHYFLLYSPIKNCTITIKESAIINNFYPDKEYVIACVNGNWFIANDSKDVTFAGINPLYNNTIAYMDNVRCRNIMLEFNQELGVTGAPNNVVTLNSIKINGVPLSNIDYASATYAHGLNHMLLVIPESAYLLTDGYSNPTIEIESGTLFENSILPEIKLTLVGGSWLDSELMEDEIESTNYISALDISGKEKFTVQSQELFTYDELDPDYTLFKFIIKPKEIIKDGSIVGQFVIYLNSTNYWDGFRFYFNYNFELSSFVLDLYDASIGGMGDEHKLLLRSKVGVSQNEYAKFEIEVQKNDDKYNIKVLEDGLLIGEIKNITPLLNEGIGNRLSIYGSAIEEIYEYKEGDFVSPEITVLSKSEYYLKEFDTIPEIIYEVSDPTDKKDDITISTYIDSDSFNDDGTLKEGIFEYIIKATDKNNNETTKIITLYVEGETKYTVTFDSKNPHIYHYGEKIEKVEDPIKDSTKKYYYEFIGWYLNGELFDFENEIVKGNINLESRFVEKDVLYSVTLKGSVEGTILLKYGAQLDLRPFEKEGYNLILKIGSEEVDRIIVDKDLEVEISYSKIDEKKENNPKKKGCKSIVSSISFVALLLPLTLIINERRKKDEE